MEGMLVYFVQIREWGEDIVNWGDLLCEYFLQEK